jgi:hypothetical protein
MAATVVGVSVEDRSGSTNLDQRKEYAVTYKITTDNEQDGSQVVLGVAGLPALGDIYSVGNDVDSQESNLTTRWTIRPKSLSERIQYASAFRQMAAAAMIRLAWWRLTANYSTRSLNGILAGRLSQLRITFRPLRYLAWPIGRTASTAIHILETHRARCE